MIARLVSKFQLGVERMLRAHGYEVRIEPRGADVGVDLVAIDKTGCVWAVAVKASGAKAIPASTVMEAAWRLKAAREIVSADGAMLALESETTPFAREMAEKIGVLIIDRASVADYVPVWDSSARRAARARTRKGSSKGERVPADTPKAADKVDTPRHEVLTSNLRAVGCGRESWVKYEDTVIELLNFLFIPPLDVPRVQTVSDDKLDRRDAVYKIGYSHRVWNAIKHECATRLLVAEFKNSCSPPDQKDVESIQQYLYGHAFRSLGFLCSRRPPSESALQARRRAWTEFRKLVLFIDDDLFCQMLALRGAGDDPSIIIDKAIDDFFTDLSA